MACRVAQYGWTPAHLAAQNGHVEALRYLGELKEGTLLEASDKVRWDMACWREGTARGRGQEGWVWGADGAGGWWWEVGKTGEGVWERWGRMGSGSCGVMWW